MRKIICIIIAMLLASSGLLFAGDGHVVPKDAEIKKVTIYQDKVISSSKALITFFDISILNKSDKPKKYDVVVIVDNVGGGQGALPEGDGTPVKSGEEGLVRISILTDKIPTNFKITVNEVE